MRPLTFCFCAAVAAVVGCAVAEADDADQAPGTQAVAIEAGQPMPNDQPVDVNGVNLACTGVGDEIKNDPRWRDYAVRLEFANRDAEYLADVDVTVADKSGEPLFQTLCGSPWLLVDLPPGRYSVSGTIEGITKTQTITSPKSGQARIVIRFPELPQ